MAINVVQKRNYIKTCNTNTVKVPPGWSVCVAVVVSCLIQLYDGHIQYKFR